MIHYYYGDGKGKTSAAVGAIIRALGCGMRCAFVQFLKNGMSGEVGVLRSAGADVFDVGADMRCLRLMTEDEKMALTKRQNDNLRAVTQKPYDMIVLDELGDCVDMGLADISLVDKILSLSDRELIITGHKPTARFMDKADYITKFVCEAHPYREGVPARKGVEY